jgi:hypothetical protein
MIIFSVGDPQPDPDPEGPLIFWPSGFGSGSISQRCGSGYGCGSGFFPFLIKVLSRIQRF